jgi:hypothetical protein
MSRLFGMLQKTSQQCYENTKRKREGYRLMDSVGDENLSSPGRPIGIY